MLELQEALKKLIKNNFTKSEKSFIISLIMKQIILMADIIESRKQPQAQLLKEFQILVDEINRSYSRGLKSPLTITLGDEFQGIANNIDTALSIVISLEENIIHHKFEFNIRYVIYEGEVSTKINRTSAHGMLGTGLTSAREHLTTMKKSTTRFEVLTKNPLFNEIINDAFSILAQTKLQWKHTKDYPIISEFLRGSDYKKTALKLGKNRSLMWKRYNNLHISTYTSAKNIIKKITSLK